MEDRAEIQSFDLRTLQLVQKKYMKRPTLLPDEGRNTLLHALPAGDAAPQRAAANATINMDRNSAARSPACRLHRALFCLTQS